MKHQFDLTVTTDRMVQLSTMQVLVERMLAAGQDDAVATADIDGLHATRELLENVEFTLTATPVPTTQLAARARLFVMGLDEAGFGKDEPINGGDCVEFIDQSQQLLRLLPTLAELAEAVDRFLRARVPEDGSYSQIIEPLIAAHTKLKED